MLLHYKGNSEENHALTNTTWNLNIWLVTDNFSFKNTYDLLQHFPYKISPYPSFKAHKILQEQLPTMRIFA